MSRDLLRWDPKSNCPQVHFVISESILVNYSLTCLYEASTAVSVVQCVIINYI